MKILKMLAVFLVLLALTVGAVAEEIPCDPYEAGELKLYLPEGLAADVTPSKGHIDIVVDSKNTKWEVVATQLTHWNTIQIYAETDCFFGATNGLGNIFYTDEGISDWSDTAMKDIYDQGFKMLIRDIQEQERFYLGGDAPMMDYSVATNALIPITYSTDSGNCMYFLAAFCDDELNIKGVKYCTISITYTDSSVRKVAVNKVPVNRIIPSTKASAKVTAGNVPYELENGDTSTELITKILPPEGARSYLCSDGSYGEAGELEVASFWARPKDYFYANEKTYLWYDGEPDADGKPTGNLVRAERIQVSASVGKAVAWPNYASENETTKLANSDISFAVENAVKGNTASFATIAYDEKIGTALVARNENVAVPNEDLTNYKLIQTINAPDKAKYYRYTWSESVKGSFLGASQADGGVADAMYWLITEKQYNVPENKKVVIEDDLFEAANYSGDEGLTTYYDAFTTEDYAGVITFIQWYDELGNELGLPCWYAKQFKTMALDAQPEIESSIPSDADTPTLVTTADAGEYKLNVISYPQSSESGTQIHYELHLIDADGNEVELKNLSDSVQLFIPFPDSIKNADELTFNVNHYDAAGKKVVESANEEGTSKITLERNKENTGVYMTVTSLSPFVLSYKAVECKHERINYASSVSGSDKNSEGVVIETCNDCTDHKASWVITVDKTCVAGKELAYKITHSAEWLGGEPTITYINPDAMETYNTTPTELGKYTMVVKFESGAMLHIPFEVVAAPAMPATGDRSLPLAALLVIAALATTTAFALRRKATRA